jgi:hypothetical protein
MSSPAHKNQPASETTVNDRKDSPRPLTGVQMPLLPTGSQDAVLVRLFADVVERVTPKVAAYELDVKGSYLSHCLSGNNHNHVRAEWLSWAVRQPGGEEIARYLSGLAGYDLIPSAPLEPAEELARLREAMTRLLGPELRAVVDAEVKRGRPR